MAITHHAGVSSFGVPLFGLGGLIPVPGDVYFVHPANAVAADGFAPGNPLKPRLLVSACQDSMTANQNDVAVLIGNGSAAATNVVSESATQTWSKDLTHIISGQMERVGHRASIRPNATSITITMTQSADGCVFANFHITNQATAAANRVLAITGQRNSYYNLHIAGGFNQTGADRADMTDILMPVGGNGELYFENCTIGLDTVERAGAGAHVLFTASGGSTRNEFRSCRFISWLDATGFTPVQIPSGGIDRYLIFDNCIFTSAGAFTGGSTPAECLSVNASAGGVVIFKQSIAVGFTAVETTNSTNVYVQDLYGAGTTPLAIATTV